jgi:hypothetical protein
MCFLNAGQFLFEALRSLDIQMVNFLMDMEGKVYGADFRVWKTMRLTTLQNWPPTMPLRAAGQRAHHMDPSSHAATSCRTSKADFVFAQGCNGSLSAPSALMSDFVRSGDRIICIFPAQAHWALLWGQLNVNVLRWLYCDGLPGHVDMAATELAAWISDELSLGWALDPGHLFQQSDDHTCGTVALLHVGP